MQNKKSTVFPSSNSQDEYPKYCVVILPSERPDSKPKLEFCSEEQKMFEMRPTCENAKSLTPRERKCSENWQSLLLQCVPRVTCTKPAFHQLLGTSTHSC